MEVERRYYTAEIRGASKEGEMRVISGHAAVFDTLSENLGGFREKIAPGAFDDVLQDDVRALFNHDNNYPLGRSAAGTLRLSVDETGLNYEVDMPDTTYARDLVASMERGDVNQSSFAFAIESDDWTEDSEGRIIRTINKFARLYDVSPVTVPAYPDAKIALRGLEQYQASKAPNNSSLYRAKLQLLGV